MRTTLPTLTAHTGDADVATSLIIVAATGMMPGQKFHAAHPDADPENKYDTRAVLIVRDTEGQWSTYHGLSLTADDRTWNSTLEMARYIVRTVL